MFKSLKQDREIVYAALLAVITTIIIMVFTASQANANYYAGPSSDSTTISHCGYVPAGETNYTQRERNVRIIQSKLMAMGYSVGNTGIDGLYGPMTKGAIKRFQDDYGIQANGYVGGETATLLAYASHPSANVHRCKHAFLGIGR